MSVKNNKIEVQQLFIQLICITCMLHDFIHDRSSLTLLNKMN